MTIRQELELQVSAVNNVLKSRVKSMSLVTLLRNIHPGCPKDYTLQLLREKQITREEASEFTKLIGHDAF